VARKYPPDHIPPLCRATAPAWDRLIKDCLLMKTTPQSGKIYYGTRAGAVAEVLVLEADGRARSLTPEASLTLRNHSPTGFEWGYRGSGPAQLALGILLDYYGGEHLMLVVESYQLFKEVVALMPDDKWDLTGAELQMWMEANAQHRLANAVKYFACKWDGAKTRLQ
jgi:hypothetical protein